MEPKETSSKSILLVDDDHDDCFIFESALTEISSGLRFSCLTDSALLAEHLVQETPDLIFLDVNMPRKNGFECLADIKARAPYKDIPVIMYSNSARLQELEKAYEQGAALYIKKPSAYSDLIQSLQEVLQKKLERGTQLERHVFL